MERAPVEKGGRLCRRVFGSVNVRGQLTAASGLVVLSLSRLAIVLLRRSGDDPCTCSMSSYLRLWSLAWPASALPTSSCKVASSPEELVECSPLPPPCHPMVVQAVGAPLNEDIPSAW